jgi:predicted transposase/invertase (TIGR01784 family)
MYNFAPRTQNPTAMFDERRERYINPYTDFGFKKLFGTEMNNDLLISFLNALFKDGPVVKDVTYVPNEQLGVYGSRRAIFDVYCETESGEKIIVEMQKTEQAYFKDRSVFYASFPIQQQGKTGADWNFQLKSVYTIGILNFVFPEDEYDPECYHHEVKLMDTTDHHVFYDKLTFIYLEMPKFNKTEDELEGMLDKWLFVLKNLTRLFDRPAALQERVFRKLFEQAEIARFTPEEVIEYEDSLKVYRDLKNSMDTSYMKGVVVGREEGREEERIANARKMKKLGVAHNIIVQVTGLSKEEVDRL